MLLAHLDWAWTTSPMGIGTLAVMATFTWLIIDSIGGHVSTVMRNRQDADLKIELAARNMSADEIVRVVQAGRGEQTHDSSVPGVSQTVVTSHS